VAVAILVVAGVVVGTVWGSARPTAQLVSEEAPTKPDVLTSVAPSPTPAPSALAATLPGVQQPSCANTPRGWLAAETRKKGTFRVPKAGQAPPGTNTTLQIYLDRTYAVCGQPLAIHLSSARPVTVVVDAIRVGQYADGLTGRTVWTSPAFPATPQPHLPAQPRHTEDNAWPAALQLVPTAAWPPGLYLVRARTPSGDLPDALTSVYVQAHGTKAQLLAIGADLTQLAYNDQGGASLYRAPGATKAEEVANRAYVASPHRALGGRGLGHLLTSEVSLAIMLDKIGLTADWTSDMSLDADPSQILGYHAVVLPGHSEYWTRRNYDTLTYAVDDGTNLAVLGANEIYWHPRLTRDARGSVTTMTVYRMAKLDPVRDREETTVQWRDVPLNRDPASLTGLGMAGVGVQGSGRVWATPAWIFQGTGLRRGSQLPDLYGNEGDGPRNPNAPKNLQVLISSQATANGNRVVTLATAYYSRPGGAGVFNAGTTEWLCAALDRCNAPSRSPEVRHVLLTMTANVLRAFALAHAGSTHPSGTPGGP
jgi:hypothetical protein